MMTISVQNLKKQSFVIFNSQEVKGYAQLKGKAMPKMCERGYAQKTSHIKTKFYEGHTPN